MTAFGPDGPYTSRPGIDFLAQGYAGVLAINGRPGARLGTSRHRCHDLAACDGRSAAALRVRDRPAKASASTSASSTRSCMPSAPAWVRISTTGEVARRRAIVASTSRRRDFHLQGRQESGHHLPLGEVLQQFVRWWRTPASATSSTAWRTRTKLEHEARCKEFTRDELVQFHCRGCVDRACE